MLILTGCKICSVRIMMLGLKLQADVDTLNDMVPGRDAMLKGIDPIIHAELLHVLMLMGHGDDLVICDINHPAATIAAKTAYGSLINLSGCGLAEATRAILTLFPLDTFVEKPVCRMEVVGDPERQMPVFAQIQHIIDAAEGRPVCPCSRSNDLPFMRPPAGPSRL